ncbi:putative vacuolar protein sorting-associated protein [Helianthus anomalus]
MQPGSISPPPFALIPLAFNHDNLTPEGFGISRFFFLGSLLLSPGGPTGGDYDGDGGMDFSKVGEKLLSSVRSARSLGFFPSNSDRPEVPERAAAAATIARALASIPPHQRHNISSSSEELSSIYGSEPSNQALEELEEEFYEEEFDPVRHTLENLPHEESDLAYFEGKAALRLLQLDKVTEILSRQVMEHHEVMVKGMDLVGELEKDLKVANVICMNGRRHLTSSRNEVSRDLVVNTSSKRKQTLMDILQILSALRRAKDMQAELETHVNEENFFKAFQVLSEYLQLLDSLSDLLAIQEMSRGVEIWLARTLQKLDSLLLGVCQDFKETSFLTVVDAYALIGDVSGLAEKIQSFFMQEVISETHAVLKSIVLEDLEASEIQSTRLTYSDLCTRIPESEFRKCLLATLSVLFKLMCSYHSIMSFHSEYKASMGQFSNEVQKQGDETGSSKNVQQGDDQSLSDSRDDSTGASSSGSPWFHLRNDATSVVSQTLQRGRRNLWQLTTSRVSVLLSSAAVSSTSIHQFLKIYEDLNIFILAGEAFCGAQAADFRQKVKSICENYYLAFHKQNVHALKMVLEKESWFVMPPETIQTVSFAGLVGDGAALISQSQTTGSQKLSDLAKTSTKQGGFSHWVKDGNPFSKHDSKECDNSPNEKVNGVSHNGDANRNINGHADVSDDENEDLLADFIDEDSQLPSRIAKPKHLVNRSLSLSTEDMTAHTGSSICVLRLMDKYARLMQKLEIINVEFFKGIRQLFGIFFHFVFESFGHLNTSPPGKAINDVNSYRLKTALSRISQDCNQWIKSASSSDPYASQAPLNMTFSHMEITPTSPPSHTLSTSFGLKERCAGADTISIVARVLYKSKAHLQSVLLTNNAAVVEEFYLHLVDSVPDLTEQIHRTTAKLLLHISGYADRIANSKWEVKELGMEHNGYVDLLLGEFKHYKTRLAHGGIRTEVQDHLIEYGLENISEILVEGLSRVKRCSDEGRALMLLDLQVLINGLQHFVTINVKPKLQTVETFIKAYYLPETEYVHWARTHPEYTKSQMVGLINLVATMKGWKRKNRLEVLEKIEAH